MLKKIALITVLILVVSLLVAGCTFPITSSPTPTPTPTPIPNKRLNYPLFGQAACDPVFPWGYGYQLTDGTGTVVHYACNGTPAYTSSGGSNQLQYMIDHGWGIEFVVSHHMFLNYPNELATKGAGNTTLDNFKKLYVDVMDKNNIKWWLELSDVMNAQSLLTYQTPGYDSVHYTPTSGMAASYESSFGAALDFIEHNCSTNFQGYSFEQAYTNGVIWLQNRTNYSVSEKDWSGWDNNLDSRGVNVLKGTNANGTDISPMPTPLQRVGMLDELIVEIFDQQYFTDWSAFLPKVRAAYPNLLIVLNVDQVCANENWNNGAPYENGTDLGWWAPQGLGEPNNRCHAEQQGALDRINSLYEINGKPFDGLIYNFLWPAFPEGGSSVPDITWFLQWADTTFRHVINPIPTPTLLANSYANSDTYTNANADAPRWLQQLL